MRVRSRSFQALAGTRAGRHALVYLVTRVGNGGLGLLQTAIAIVALGTTQAGMYFVAWTAAWMVSLAFRLGSDSLLPRLVAEARLSDAREPSLRRVARFGLVTTVVATPLAFAALRLPLDRAAMAATALTAVMWGAIFVLGGLMRAHDRTDRSGIATNLIWGTGTTAAPLIALFVDVDWTGLMLLTAATSALALVGVAVLTLATLGRPAVTGLLARIQPAGERDRDAIGAALLSGLVEALVWAPVLIAGMLAVAPAELAAIFAATRLSGVLSWGYQAIVAVLSPRLAAALAAGNVRRARLLLRRGSVMGGMVTLPTCLAGLLLAPIGVELLLGAPSATGTAALRFLIIGRLIDAVCGPLGEALLIGRKTWIDACLVTLALVIGGVAAALSEPSLGPEAAAAGAALALATANGLRAIVVTRLLRHGWPADLGDLRPRLSFAATRGAVALLSSMAVALAAYVADLPVGAGIACVVVAAPLSAAGLFTLGALRHGARATLLSPLALLALLLLAHFGLRAVALLSDPSSAVAGVAQFHIPDQYVIQAAALGILITTALGVGFLLAPDAPQRLRDARIPDERRIRSGVLACLGFGTLLWGALFLRLGGFGALLSNPAALHLNQFGGLYGVFGLLLCLAALLVALWCWLQRPTPAALWLTALAGCVSTAASVALATRGPLVATIAAALALVLRNRRPSLRTAATAAVVLSLGIVVLSAARQLREYAQIESLGAAAESTLRTDPLELLSGDLIEFDHLVALTVLVPDTLPWLEGESIAAVPGAFVPRTLWPGKPLPIDYKLSEKLYGPTTTAGTPFTLAGELFWNFGAAWAVIIAAIAGLLTGSAWWRWGQRSGWPGLINAMVLGYTYLILTRPLAPMVQTTTFALVALFVAVLASDIVSWRPAVSPVRKRSVHALARSLRPPSEPFEHPWSAGTSVRAVGSKDRGQGEQQDP